MSQDEEPLWAELERAWDEWRSGPDRDGIDYLRRQLAVEQAVDSWPEEERRRPVQWLRERIATGEQPGIWREYGRSGPWSDPIFVNDDDPRGDLIDGIVFDHMEVEPRELQRLVKRAGQMRELVLIESNILPSIEALFAPPANWSSLQRLHVEANGNEDDLRSIIRAPLPALHDFVLLDEEPLPPVARELLEASWWRQLRRLWLGETSSDTLAALAAADMPLLEELVITEPSAEAREVWADPAHRPRLRQLETQTRSGEQIDVFALPCRSDE